MTLVYLVAAWTAGIFLASSSETRPEIWLGIAAGAFVLAYLSRHNRPWRLGFLCAALFVLGAGRYAWATQPLEDDHIAHYTDSGWVTLTGMIVRDPDVRDNHVNLHIEADTVEQQATEGLVLVQAPRYGEYAYGDRVEVSGPLLTPPEFDDFSYRDYLAQRGIHAMIPNAQVTVLAHDQGRPWYALMYDLKAHAHTTIQQLLPSPQAPLLNGILIGVESSIPDDVREAFNRTGTTHVIAISGANIIVVIRVLMGMLKPGLGERRASIVTLAGIGVYTAFVGGDPAVIRAALMGGMALFAAQIGRRTYGITSLAFVSWLMTIWNPQILWDVGFQLSVAATAGLVLFGDQFTTWLEELLRRGFAQTTARQITQWLAEPLVISIAAQITTTPLIVLHFGRLSAASLLANLMIVPAQPYIMIFGWLSALAGMVWTPLGEPLAWVVWLPLTYTLEIVRSLGSFEWASTDMEWSSGQAWAVYAILLAAALLVNQHPEDRATMLHLLQRRITATLIIASGVVLSILVWITALSLPDGKLHVWFLDIGHGHAVLIQSPNGAQILVDGGPNPTQLRKAVGDELPFWDRDLDLLIVTQPKSSAIKGLPALLERYDVDLALTNGQAADSDSYHALLRAWNTHDIAVQTVTAGYQIETSDGVTLEILHPQFPPEDETDLAAAGMVIRVSYGDASFLLTPDIDEDTEQVVLEAGWYTGSTVLELPAHGSEKANSPNFLRAVRPQAVVVSVGAGNRAGLPEDVVVDRLATISDGPLYRTDQVGTVEVVTDGHKLWIYTDR
jgi:competence protein ComEC